MSKELAKVTAVGAIAESASTLLHSSPFYNDCKAGLAPREKVVTVDFAKNYSFTLQDAAQGFHWKNSQATIHPFAAYFKSGEVCHLSFVIVSECLHHDTTAMLLYQRHLIRKYLPARSQPRKIVYFFRWCRFPIQKQNKISSIYAIIKKITGFQWNGTFQLLPTEKESVMALEEQ